MKEKSWARGGEHSSLLVSCPSTKGKALALQIDHLQSWKCMGNRIYRNARTVSKQAESGVYRLYLRLKGHRTSEGEILPVGLAYLLIPRSSNSLLQTHLPVCILRIQKILCPKPKSSGFNPCQFLNSAQLRDQRAALEVLCWDTHYQRSASIQ